GADHGCPAWRQDCRPVEYVARSRVVSAGSDVGEDGPAEGNAAAAAAAAQGCADDTLIMPSWTPRLGA
ncbi:MAG: hypothetical protein ACRDY7_09585, partial [Acidimicrobiia bacterium]